MSFYNDVVVLCEVPNYVKLTPVLARFGRIYDIPISGSLHIIPAVWPGGPATVTFPVFAMSASF